MQHIKALLSQLKADYPDITFVVGTDFKWSKDEHTLVIDPDHPHASTYILHELGHALLGHEGFRFDIDLLRHEREAWERAIILAPAYNITVDEGLIEESLDTYREWLHSRSLCPSCNSTGLQTKTSTYICVNCRCSWRPNDARRVNLRRYRII